MVSANGARVTTVGNLLAVHGAPLPAACIRWLIVFHLKPVVSIFVCAPQEALRLNRSYGKAKQRLEDSTHAQQKQQQQQQQQQGKER